MNQQLRSLIQLLGEAIHESVSESEQISEVVEDIRKQGFDVMLMLEATIGLNEVAGDTAGESRDGEPSSTEIDGHENDKPFNAQDLSFLRSLRIKVEDDEQGKVDS